MLISVDIVSENFFYSNNYNVLTLIELKNKIAEEYYVLSDNQEWYFNEKQINNNFTLISGNYTLYLLSKNYISLKMQLKNKIIKLPFISEELKISELKDILSIKDNIYLNTIKLCDEKKIGDYDINNNILLVKSFSINLI